MGAKSLFDLLTSDELRQIARQLSDNPRSGTSWIESLKSVPSDIDIAFPDVTKKEHHVFGNPGK